MAHKNTPAAEWFTSASFWHDLYPLMFDPSRFAAAREQVDPLLQLARPRGRQVLDLCCGPGRFAVPLATRGYTVTGVDRTPYLLTQARRLARKQGAQVEWFQADMRDFRRPAAFDLALNLFTSFGYFARAASNQKVLNNLYASLKPGGVLVLDVAGRESLLRSFQSVGYDRGPGGVELIQRREFSTDRKRLHNEWLLIKNNRVRRWPVDLWVYSAREITAMLRRAGFRQIRVVSNFRGSPYPGKGTRLIAIAHKP